MSYYRFLNIWFHEGIANQRRTSFAWNELASAVQRLIGWRTEFVQIRLRPLRIFNKFHESKYIFNRKNTKFYWLNHRICTYIRLKHLRKASKGRHFFKCVVSMWGGANACSDGLEHFFHVQMGNFLFFFWESERLPGWFVHFLAHFGNLKRLMKGIASEKKYSTVPVW